MIFNVTSGGGTGGTLVITAPAGVTCTVSKDGKTKTKTVDQYGYATFKGLDTGTWEVVITDGSQTSPAQYVEVTADYAVTMSFFSATIAVKFPEGSTCTCSDGSTTLTAPDTSGSYTFTVPNAGTWTVSCTDGEDSDSTTVTITTDGESQSVELSYTLWLYKNGEFDDVYTMSGALTYNNSTYTGTSYPNITNEGGILTLTTIKKGASSCGYATDNKINMSKFSTLKINLTSITWGLTTSWQGDMCVATERDGKISEIALAKVSFGKNTAEGELILDVSKIEQEAYVVFCIPDMAQTQSISFSSLCLCV